MHDGEEEEEEEEKEAQQGNGFRSGNRDGGAYTTSSTRQMGCQHTAIVEDCAIHAAGRHMAYIHDGHDDG